MESFCWKKCKIRRCLPSCISENTTLFVIGHIPITTALVAMQTIQCSSCSHETDTRPFFYWHLQQKLIFFFGKNSTYLIRRHIYCQIINDNKIENQYTLLAKTRKKNELTSLAKEGCINALSLIPSTHDYNSLLGYRRECR
jgi:hypothetical protein